MALQSVMLPLGTTAPDFSLPDVRSDALVRNDADGRPLLVAFLCRHCPYVKHVQERFAALANEAVTRGVAVVAIGSNDAQRYPQDAPDQLARQAEELGFGFPYLYDEDQSVAAAYTAACTPDFFLFDGDHELVYRGRMDAATPGNNEPVTGAELAAAIDAVLAGDLPGSRQLPAMGCGIKWKPGNEPSTYQPRTTPRSRIVDDQPGASDG